MMSPPFRYQENLRCSEKMLIHQYSLASNEAPCSKLRGMKAALRRSSPRHLCRAKALATADHPCSKLQGILAKANKKPVIRRA